MRKKVYEAISNVEDIVNELIKEIEELEKENNDL